MNYHIDKIKKARNNKLKETYIKNSTSYYFNDIILMTLILIIFYWTKYHMTIF